MVLPDRFETERLCAERVELGHRDDLRRMDGNPELMARLGGVRPASVTDEYLENSIRHWSEFGFGVWILRDRQTGRLAGRALLRHVPIDGMDEIEVGYGLFPEFWGRGLATEIAAAIVRMAFDDLGLPSVIALTVPDHVKSQRVMTKVGMTYERHVMHAGLQHVLYRARRETATPQA